MSSKKSMYGWQRRAYDGPMPQSLSPLPNETSVYLSMVALLGAAPPAIAGPVHERHSGLK